MTAAYSLFSIPVRQLDNNGNPVAGALLHTWVSGTNTNLPTYTSAAGNIPLPNPIVADSEGFFPQIWVKSGVYDLEARLPDDVTVLWDVAGIVSANSVAQDQIDAINAALSGSGGSAGVGFIQAGTGAVARTVQAKLREVEVSVIDFGADPTGTLDSLDGFTKAATASKRIRIPAGTYKLSASVTTITVNHQIRGDGFGVSVLNPSYTPTSTTAPIAIAAPTTDTKVALLLESFTINGKFGITVGGTRASHPNDGAIIGGRINVQVTGTYSSGSGDSAYNTDKVRDTSNALVSCATGASLNALNTFADIGAYGVGIQLTKCFDLAVDDPQFYGCGVSLVLLGSDLVKWHRGRSHEVGIHVYSERIGTFGSQFQIDAGADMLHNRRAGGFLLNGTKFDRLYDTYAECYSDSACYLFAEGTEGVIVENCRFDDPYYTGGGGTAAGTTPLMIFNSPRYNNRVVTPQFQKFSPFAVSIPGVRVLGDLSACDTNHPELVAIEPGNGYAAIRYTNIQMGCRYGALRRDLYNPNNVPMSMGGSISPLAVVDGSKNVFYNAASSTYTARFDIDQIPTTYTLSINAKVVSGTMMAATVEHHRYDGTLLTTLYSGSFGSYTTTDYKVFSPTAFNLVQEPSDGDYLLVSWTANTARVGGVQVK